MVKVSQTRARNIIFFCLTTVILEGLNLKMTAGALPNINNIEDENRGHYTKEAVGKVSNNPGMITEILCTEYLRVRFHYLAR